jgi:KaiC/GvpD/RAD55 family RecA-like ATPase
MSLGRVKRYKTYITAIDGMLQGGIPAGSIILLLGEPGCLTETFAQQIVFNRSRMGDMVYYVNIDKSREDVKADLAVFNWDITQFEEEDSWNFIDVYSARFLTGNQPKGIMGEGIQTWGAGTINMLRTQFFPTITQTKSNCTTVIETISRLLTEYSIDIVLELIEYLIHQTRQNQRDGGDGGLHLLLMGKGIHDEKTEAIISNMVDGVIEFFFLERMGTLERCIRIKKLRKTIFDTRTLVQNLTENGIKIETTTRI